MCVLSALFKTVAHFCDRIVPPLLARCPALPASLASLLPLPTLSFLLHLLFLPWSLFAFFSCSDFLLETLSAFHILFVFYAPRSIINLCLPTHTHTHIDIYSHILPHTPTHTPHIFHTPSHTLLPCITNAALLIYAMATKCWQ